MKCNLGLAFDHVGSTGREAEHRRWRDRHRVRLERVVNLDAVLRVGVHPDRLEIQILDIGQPTAAQKISAAGTSATSPVAMSL